MKTPIALFNLWHQGTKTLVSIGGVAFALLLVFMQLGFMGAVSHTATNVFQKLDFDILLRPADYLHLYESSTFERSWLEVAGNTDGVASAHPFWIIIQNWRKLPSESEFTKAAGFESQYLPIAVMGFEPYRPVFRTGVIEAIDIGWEQLARGDVLLLDDSTKSDYGPWNGKRFTDIDIKLSADKDFPERAPEIGGNEFQIAGLFELGTGLAANGAAIMGQKAFAKIFPWNTDDSVSLGLIKLEEGQDARAVIAELKSRFQVSEPANVEVDGFLAYLGSKSQSGSAVSVLSYEEALKAEQERWLWKTPIGLIFQMGVVISLLVGAAIVYMVLSTDVANRLPEYATLLAMGYSRSYLVGIVMTQAMVLCALGFVTSWALAEGLYRVTSVFSGIPLIMTGGTIVLVAVLGVLMCVVSAILALRKLWKAEPASLF
ncbi:MAG: ABC transporter permease [Planctomycetota bacterium]|nr:ABC transporter permease [Planctomycetota bacterium]